MSPMLQAEEQGKRVAALKAEGKQNPDGEAAKQVRANADEQIVSCKLLPIGDCSLAALGIHYGSVTA